MSNKNKLYRQIGQCQYWYNGTLKRFAELIYLIVANEIEVV